MWTPVQHGAGLKQHLTPDALTPAPFDQPTRSGTLRDNEEHVITRPDIARVAQWHSRLTAARRRYELRSYETAALTGRQFGDNRLIGRPRKVSYAAAQR